MEKVSFYESLIRILKLISSIPFLLEILLLTAFLALVMIFFYLMKSKKGKFVTIIIYIVTLLLLPFSHLSFFINLSDKLVENFVKIFFFPNWIVYLFMLVVTDISIFVLIKRNFNEKKPKLISTLNILYFFLFQFLFFVIIYECSKNNVDVFDNVDLYNNSNLVSLIQVSSYIFWIRILILILSYIINKLSVDTNKINDEKALDNKNKNFKSPENSNNNKNFDDIIAKDSKNDEDNKFIRNSLDNKKNTYIKNNNQNNNSKKEIDLNLETGNNDNKKFFDDFYD